MAVQNIKPYPDYENLLRQFHALKNLVVCMEEQRAVLTREWQIDREARANLESERAANAMLTARVEELEARLTVKAASSPRPRSRASVPRS